MSNPPVATGLTSTALDRAPGPSRNFVRGKAGYVPFMPGGLDVLKQTSDLVDLQEGSSQLRKIAPGLSRGLRLSNDEEDSDVIGLGGSVHRDQADTTVPVRASLGSQVCHKLTLQVYQNGHASNAPDDFPGCSTR